MCRDIISCCGIFSPIRYKNEKFTFTFYHTPPATRPINPPISHMMHAIFTGYTVHVQIAVRHAPPLVHAYSLSPLSCLRLRVAASGVPASALWLCFRATGSAAILHTRRRTQPSHSACTQPSGPTWLSCRRPFGRPRARSVHTPYLRCVGWACLLRVNTLRKETRPSTPEPCALLPRRPAAPPAGCTARRSWQPPPPGQAASAASL